ncbi:hypothetical protein E3P99_03275 [Wallemia hederae]|uniref:Bola-like protein n=1 Tax=Wallemia hederae TaxID=1540922 RepID=A0A4T0FFW6_9BASI|nr:hypothetical protein E3P99_03275 [Wallemia hederae]
MITNRLFSAARLSTRQTPLAHRLRLYSQQPPPAAEEPLAGESRIKAKLEQSFKPSRLQVMDVSGGCGAFYAINIASDSFKGLTTVKQHRLVNETLKEDIAGIHGLQLKTAAE